MPEIALYRFDIDAGTDSGYGIAVPQIMVTGIGPPNRRNRFLIVAVDRRLRQVMPKRIVKMQRQHKQLLKKETIIGAFNASNRTAPNAGRMCSLISDL